MTVLLCFQRGEAMSVGVTTCVTLCTMNYLVSHFDSKYCEECSIFAKHNKNYCKTRLDLYFGTRMFVIVLPDNGIVLQILVPVFQVQFKNVTLNEKRFYLSISRIATVFLRNQ